MRALRSQPAADLSSPHPQGDAPALLDKRQLAGGGRRGRHCQWARAATAHARVLAPTRCLALQVLPLDRPSSRAECRLGRALQHSREAPRERGHHQVCGLCGKAEEFCQGRQVGDTCVFLGSALSAELQRRGGSRTGSRTRTTDPISSLNCTRGLLTLQYDCMQYDCTTLVVYVLYDGDS